MHKQRSSQANNNERGRMKSHALTLTPHEGEGHEGEWTRIKQAGGEE